MTDAPSRREEIAAAIDRQLYEHKRRSGFDAPADDEWDVTLTAGQWRELETILAKADAILATGDGREIVKELVETSETLAARLGIVGVDDEAIIHMRVCAGEIRRLAAARAKAKDWLEGR